MRRHGTYLTIVMLIVGASSLTAPDTAQAQPAATRPVLSGTVVKVVDGDTIEVLGNNGTHQQIRLAGIDAPESGQPYWRASREHLISLLVAASKIVRVEYYERDEYGQLVGKVFAAGVDLCLEQIKAGFAWHYEKYQDEQGPDDRALYAEAEKGARARRLGLWWDNDPVPPREFRRLHK